MLWQQLGPDGTMSSYETAYCISGSTWSPQIDIIPHDWLACHSLRRAEAANAHTPASWETGSAKISNGWKNTCDGNKQDVWPQLGLSSKRSLTENIRLLIQHDFCVKFLVWGGWEGWGHRNSLSYIVWNYLTGKQMQGRFCSFANSLKGSLITFVGWKMLSQALPK